MADETLPLLPPSSRKQTRPSLLHAATTSGLTAVTAATNKDFAKRELTRPNLPARSAKTKSVDILRRQHGPGSLPTGAKQPRPSFFSRISQFLDSDRSELERGPPPPTFWTDHAHRDALLAKWDAVREHDHNHERSANNFSQLAEVRSSMLQDFAELGAGDIVLERKWMTYVLGKALRAPFSHDGDVVGRWEVLAHTGGTRGNWGAW